MSLKQKISRKTGIIHVPASFQIIGNIALAKFMNNKTTEKKKIANALMEILPKIKTVCEVKGIKGEYRTPKIRKIAGNGTITIHKEHGIKYKIDVSKIMFSKGNLSERKRIIPLIKKNEKILDMFAGIGYFSLGIAKNKSVKITAVEKNKITYNYLKGNIRLNKLNNISAINSDNRKIKTKEKFDRVIMGYFPNTEVFLSSALKYIKSGGSIHYHNTYKEKELWKKPLEQINNAAKKFWKRIAFLSKKKEETSHSFFLTLIMQWKSCMLLNSIMNSQKNSKKS